MNRGISAYVFCNSNPVRNIDQNGEIWVDANKNKVWDENGWTRYATPQMQELGNTLRKTITGRLQFDKLTINPAEIQVTINNTDQPRKYGHMDSKHGATLDRVTGISKLNSGAEIVIYKLNAKERASRSDGTLTTIEAMAVNFGHEIEHTTNENITLNVNKASASEIERKPNRISNLLKIEFERMKPIIQENDNRIKLLR